MWGWKYGAGTGLLKKGTGTFPNWFFQGLSFLHLEIIFAKLYYTSEEKLLFSAFIILWIKSSFKLSKNKPVRMSKEGWCIRLGQEGGCLHEGGGNCLKYFRKEGRGNIWKRGSKLGQGMGAFKRGAGTSLRIMMKRW